MTARAGVLGSSEWATVISFGIPFAGVLIGIPAALASPTASSYVSWFPDFVVGWLFFGAAGWSYRTSRVTTAYCLLIGCLWFAGSVLPLAGLWHRGAIAHLVLAWPLLATMRWWVLAAVVLSYALHLVPGVAGLPVVSLAFATALVVAGAVRARTRRVRVPLAVAAAFALGVGGSQVLQAGIPGPAGVYAGLLVYEVGIAAIAFIVAISAVRPAPTDPADIVLDIRRRSPGPASAEALLEELGDADDPAILQALATADRLTRTNALLQLEASERLRALTDSRDRLAAAEREERARILRLLGEELDPMYADVRAALAALPASAGAERIRQRVAESAAEVEALRAGLAPTDKADLASDVLELASRSPIPLRVGGLPRHLPVEWVEPLRYICSEAILNAVKHSDASAIDIRGRRRWGRWIIDIADDGRGGAVIERGSGLRGIIERAGRIGARVELTSPPGRGTRMSIELPRFSRPVAPSRRWAVGRRSGARTRGQASS